MNSINSLDLVENEFKVLANEMKKRYNNIKEVRETYLSKIMDLILFFSKLIKL